MSRLNTKADNSHLFSDERTCGGLGAVAANDSPENQLRRCVLACLLWENPAYGTGEGVAGEIATLVPLVDPVTVASLAIECRNSQKLRHVPLLIAREMCRHETHRKYVAQVLENVIQRPDELCEFLAIYWKDGKCPISNQAKRGLARAFRKFDEYQLSKWNKDSKIKLRDVMFLVHPKPRDNAQQELWNRLVANQLTPPDTWETGLSAAKTPEARRQVWMELIETGKLGASALLKNLRNMQNDNVSRDDIARAINNANPARLLPLDFLKAAKHAPNFTRQLEDLMFRCSAQFPKLSGWSIFVVDVSGSMNASISSMSDFTRRQAAAAMAMLASEMCENVIVYATAGSDGARQHLTERIDPCRGFALCEAIDRATHRLGGGGIFTRQCIDYIRGQERESPDRIIVFSDSQDCDTFNKTLPKPFGKYNYIVDVSCNRKGINYKGVWTAEISGWSESFLQYIAGFEQLRG